MFKFNRLLTALVCVGTFAFSASAAAQGRLTLYCSSDEAWCQQAKTEKLLASEVVVFVPFPYLAQAQSLLESSKVRWGAQTVSDRPSGALTGEVSVAMLVDFACAYVIVGHSERRMLFGESDQLVAEKAFAVVAGGLVPVICLGETLEEREAGLTMAVVARQLSVVIERLGVKGLASSVLAYEPVWAIGTGRTASAGQVQEVHSALRGQVAAIDSACAESLRIIYGGSVKSSNADELFALPDVDGGLVGGASLVSAEFLAICEAARV